MDAHLFALLCDALKPVLEGAWLEKAQDPAPGVIDFAISPPRRAPAAGSAREDRRKAWLVLRADRRDPFLFLSHEKPSAPPSPSAPVMRIRKFASGRRILSVVPDMAERRLWLLLGRQKEEDRPTDDGEPRAVWLLLDLREGAALRFLTDEESPQPAPLRWPEPADLEAALADWRSWPVLTPALRRTLPLLDAPDAAALLEDLRLGGGDVFLYRPVAADGESAPDLPADAPPCLISAWPLPPERRPASWPAWIEECGGDVLGMTERAGLLLVLARAGREAASEAGAPLARKERRLRKLLEKLDEEEGRLTRMIDGRREAMLLRDNLWRWPADFRAPFVDVEEYGESGEIGRCRVEIDPRRTVRGQMEALFHAARRGSRGLEHVARRRAELEAEIARCAAERRLIAHGGLLTPGGDGSGGDAASLAANLPRNVQMFISSDGFALLRGRDARGNAAARRLAAPHDIWLHADGGPGSHVIIRRAHAGQELPERLLEEAGSLAACRSWIRDAARARILYAEVRHIKPMRGAAPGTVRMDRILFTREVAIRPELEALLSAEKAEA